MPGGRPKKCSCGNCRLCKTRHIAHKFYVLHKEQVVQTNLMYKQVREGRPVTAKLDFSSNISDEEMDRRALE